MRGDGMHADGGVAEQRKTVSGKAVRVDCDQRIGVALAHELHGPQSAIELRLHLGGEGFGRQAHEFQRLGAVGGHHGGAQVRAGERIVLQRQHGQRALVAKAFVGDVFVRALVLHAADDDGAAKVGHLRAHAELAARGGKSAVGGHHQRCAQRGLGLIGALVFNRGAVSGCAHAQHLGVVENLHARALGGDRMGRAAQRVVGHDPAEVFLAAAQRIEAHARRAAHRAVVHMGLADAADFVGGEFGPRAQRLEQFHTRVGEGDLASVFGRRGQCGCALLLQHDAGKARLRQRNRQRQPRRSAAHDQHIAVGCGGLGCGSGEQVGRGHDGIFRRTQNALALCDA